MLVIRSRCRTPALSRGRSDARRPTPNSRRSPSGITGVLPAAGPLLGRARSRRRAASRDKARNYADEMAEQHQHAKPELMPASPRQPYRRLTRSPAPLMFSRRGEPVAQPVEQLTFNLMVRGFWGAPAVSQRVSCHKNTRFSRCRNFRERPEYTLNWLLEGS